MDLPLSSLYAFLQLDNPESDRAIHSSQVGAHLQETSGPVRDKNTLQEYTGDQCSIVMQK